MAPPPQVLGGRLKHYTQNWYDITDDQFVLSAISGYKIPLLCKPDESLSSNFCHKYTKAESKLMANEINHLLSIGAITKCSPIAGQFISDIFLVPKKDGYMRFILNLKKFNKFVHAEHFKLEDIRIAIKLLNKNDYMTTIDLKEAYFCIPIHKDHQKYLRFYYNGILYGFTALPFGLSSSPYIFTKILQPVMALLRAQGHKSVRYLDDILCIGNSKYSCLKNTCTTLRYLQDLGFVINAKKSNLEPKMSCKFLGFVLNSNLMIIEIPEDKRHKLYNLIIKIIHTKSITIRDFSRFLGSLTATCPAITYGWAHTKSLERARYLALLNNNDNYNATMTLPSYIMSDLLWWKANIMSSVKSITNVNFIMEIFTDASTTGWGAACNNERTGGHWTRTESSNHINYLELQLFLLLNVLPLI